MRKIIVAALMLFATSSHAGNLALVCLFEPTKERFNIVTKGTDDYIQWGSDKFEAILTSFEEEMLIVHQYGRTGTFRMVWHPKTGAGYGGVEAFDGKKIEGKILCAVQ